MAKKKARAKRKGARRTVARRTRPRQGPVVRETTDAAANLQAILAGLTRQREALEQQITAISSALGAFGGPGGTIATAPAAAPSTSTYRRGSLKDTIQTVMRGNGVMRVQEVGNAVVKAGYKSKNKTLNKSIGVALAEMPDVAKVGRGRFRLG